MESARVTIAPAVVDAHRYEPLLRLTLGLSAHGVEEIARSGDGDQDEKRGKGEEKRRAHVTFSRRSGEDECKRYQSCGRNGSKQVLRRTKFRNRSCAAEKSGRNELLE